MGGNGGNGGNADFHGSTGGNGGTGGDGGKALGGAIYNGGSMYIFECTFSGNTATAGTGGTGGSGGLGPFGAGESPSGGRAGTAGGGAIFSVTNLTVIGCTFAANTAIGGTAAPRGISGTSENGDDGFAGGEASGGGIFTMGAGFVTNCTFFQNTATGGNGGAGGLSSTNGGAGGNGGNGNGGGLYNTGMVAVVNCTFVNGSAQGGTNGTPGVGGAQIGNPGKAGRSRGGGLANGGGSFLLFNSLAATNLFGFNITNISGRFVDGGYNLSSDFSPPLTNHASFRSTDARIGTLSSNGGPTFTIPLLVNSPAIDVIPGSNCPPTDQRGFPRPIPVGGLGDIGAYEVQNSGPPIISQQPTNTPAVTQLGSVTFLASASGAQPLKYQWTLAGTNLPGANTTTYTATNVSPTNIGPYVVYVTNKLGWTNSLPAFVQLPPFFTLPPTNQSILAGQPVGFSVQVSGNPPLYFQWQFNGIDLTGANDTNLFIASAAPSRMRGRM